MTNGTESLPGLVGTYQDSEWRGRVRIRPRRDPQSQQRGALDVVGRTRARIDSNATTPRGCWSERDTLFRSFLAA